MKNIFNFLYQWISKNKILAVILLFAIILRFVGIYPGFPPTHSDEGAIYSTAVKMIKKITYDPMRYDYAALPMIIHAIVYIIINPFFIIYSFLFAPDNLPKFRNVIDFYQNMLWINMQTTILYWGRFITAIFGVGLVFMVYQVAIKFFDKKSIALVAAFLTAVNYRQVLNSHIVLPDIYNAFFLLLSFYIFANLLKNLNTRNYFLSGIILGVYLSVKYHFFPVITFIFIHFIHVWLLIKKHNLKNIIKNKNILLKNLFKVDFIIAMFLIPLTFFLINPYLFFHLNEFIITNQYQARQYRLGINNLDLYSISYLYHIGIGQAISIFAILGIILGLKKYTIPTLIFLSTILPFFYLLAYYGNGGFYTRNFVTITPLLLIFAGLFLVEICFLICNKFNLKKIYTNGLIILFTIIISWNQIENSVISSFYFSQSQNYTLAKTWAINNIPNGSNVSVRTIDKFPKKKQFKIINFEYNDVFTLAEMQENKVDYGYIPLDELNLVFYWWMKEPTFQAIDYWDKSVPDSISQNTFTAKVAKELASWSVAAFIKPWQTPDVNYFIIKIPPKIELNNKKIIKEFSFDGQENLSSWFLINGFNKKVENIVIDPEVGKNQIGSIRVDRRGAYPNITQAISPVIDLNNYNQKSRIYELTAWAKAEDLLDRKEKDGYIMLDFYENNPQNITLTTKSLYTALSSRIFGTTDWVYKKITVIAPSNAKYLTINLGISGTSRFWFDDIVLSKSEETVKDPKTEMPYLNYYQIPENILFPLSHGGW